MSPSKDHKIAAIDIGSNSVHLAIAHADGAGNFRVLDSHKEATKLGHHLDKKGNLSDAGRRALFSALAKIMTFVKDRDYLIRCAATHTLREARNSGAIVEEIHQKFRIKVEIIDGIEEARLIHLGVSKGFDIENKKALVVDIGGGSTEIILAKDTRYYYTTSLKLGAVVLSKKFRDKKNGLEIDVDALDSFLRQRLVPLRNELNLFTYDIAIFSSGTAKAICNAVIKMYMTRKVKNLNHFELESKYLCRMVDTLSACRSINEVKRMTGLSEARSEIIIAGSKILEILSRILGVKSWNFSINALREGLIVDTLRRSLSHSKIKKENKNFRWENIEQFAKPFKHDGKFAMQAVQTSSHLFESLRDIEVFKARRKSFAWGELLRAAAFLHEIGKTIGYAKYHVHAEYIIDHGALLGFTEAEKHIIGCIIRYHRKSIKLKDNDPIHEFPGKWQKTILGLAALLRLTVAILRTRPDDMPKFEVALDHSKSIIYLVFYGEKSEFSICIDKIDADREIFQRYIQYDVKTLKSGIDDDKIKAILN